MNTREQLLNDINEFLIQTGMTRSTFGLKILKDSSFMSDLEQGRVVSIDLLDKLRDFMNNYEEV